MDKCRLNLPQGRYAGGLQKFREERQLKGTHGHCPLPDGAKPAKKGQVPGNTLSEEFRCWAHRGPHAQKKVPVFIGIDEDSDRRSNAAKTTGTSSGETSREVFLNLRRVNG